MKAVEFNYSQKLPECSSELFKNIGQFDLVAIILSSKFLTQSNILLHLVTKQLTLETLYLVMRARMNFITNKILITLKK